MQATARNVIPYTLGDPHFMIAAISAPAGSNGVVFQASRSLDTFGSQIVIANGVPQALCNDQPGTSVTLRGSALAPNQPAVLTFTNAPGAQRLRVNAAQVASGSATFAPMLLDQFLLGWGFQNYYPQPGFGGLVFCAVTGKGSPTSAELQVIERYLGSTAGITF
jgi:hypothetical protein